MQLTILFGGCDFFFWLVILKLGSTAIGLKTKEGVVLAVEKRITSPLLVCNLFYHFSFCEYLNLCVKLLCFLMSQCCMVMIIRFVNLWIGLLMLF